MVQISLSEIRITTHHPQREPIVVKQMSFIKHIGIGVIVGTVVGVYSFVASGVRYAADPSFRFWTEMGKLSWKEKWMDTALDRFKATNEKYGPILQSSRNIYYMEFPSFLCGLITGLIIAPNLPGGFDRLSVTKGGRLMTRFLGGGIFSLMFQYWIPFAFTVEDRKQRLEAHQAFLMYLEANKTHY